MATGLFMSGEIIPVPRNLFRQTCNRDLSLWWKQYKMLGCVHMRQKVVSCTEIDNVFPIWMHYALRCILNAKWFQNEYNKVIIEVCVVQLWSKSKPFRHAFGLGATWTPLIACVAGSRSRVKESRYKISCTPLWNQLNYDLPIRTCRKLSSWRAKFRVNTMCRKSKLMISTDQ